jgi:hypothetical protein
MTTLISKSPIVPSLVRKNLDRAENEIRRWMREQGLDFSTSDLAAIVENISPLAARGFLSYALDFVRPLTMGMGLRMARLSDTQVEVVIPYRTKNLTENGELDESVCTVAATEGVKQIWRRHAPLGHVEIDVLEMRFKKHQQLTSGGRARMELDEGLREKVLAQLRETRQSRCENNVAIFDDKDQKVAEISVKIELKWTPALNSTKD